MSHTTPFKFMQWHRDTNRQTDIASNRCIAGQGDLDIYQKKKTNFLGMAFFNTANQNSKEHECFIHKSEIS